MAKNNLKQLKGRYKITTLFKAICEAFRGSRRRAMGEGMYHIR
jgi:hypothetical protein